MKITNHHVACLLSPVPVTEKRNICVKQVICAVANIRLRSMSTGQQSIQAGWTRDSGQRQFRALPSGPKLHMDERWWITGPASPVVTWLDTNDFLWFGVPETHKCNEVHPGLLAMCFCSVSTPLIMLNCTSHQLCTTRGSESIAMPAAASSAYLQIDFIFMCERWRDSVWDCVCEQCL